MGFFLVSAICGTRKCVFGASVNGNRKKYLKFSWLAFCNSNSNPQKTQDKKFNWHYLVTVGRKNFNKEDRRKVFVIAF